MVSTHLKLLVKLDHFAKIGMKIKKIFELPPPRSKTDHFPNHFPNQFVQPTSSGPKLQQRLQSTSVHRRHPNPSGTRHIFFRGKTPGISRLCRTEKCADSLWANFRASFPWGTRSLSSIKCSWNAFRKTPAKTVTWYIDFRLLYIPRNGMINWMNCTWLL